MNRIILIGNGFDLAHGLPTSYSDFIDDLLKETIGLLREHKVDVMFKNKVCCFDFTLNKYPAHMQIDYPTAKDIIPADCKRSMYGIESAISKKKAEYAQIENVSFQIQNKFLKRLFTNLEARKWVDIENDYYKMLKEISQKNGTNLSGLAKTLNRELADVEFLLKEYLIKIEKETKIKQNTITQIHDKIYFPFCFDDVPHVHRKRLVENLMSSIRPLFISGRNESMTIGILKKKYPQLEDLDDADILGSLDGWYLLMTYEEQINYIRNTSKKNKHLFEKLLSPKEILLLDFNYTKTTENYKSFDTDIIHIHGELNNPKNPVIFGYGDEIGEDYKKIEDLEENELLKNVKSIRYQDTNNYQKLMEFIESDYYQVFVMGHSCGNSDRTLLNTLFEHENCLSIKPYFHQYGEKEEDNNYSDIVRNISRNFRDKPAMRNKVVNKTYCEPLLEYKPE